MGRLASALGAYVRAVNANDPRRFDLNQDPALLRAFDSLVSASADRAHWDKSDHFAWEILTAMDKLQND